MDLKGKGLRCPTCGSEKHFKVLADTDLHLDGDGTIDAVFFSAYGSFAEDYTCYCQSCGHDAEVEHFVKEWEAHRAPAAPEKLKRPDIKVILREPGKLREMTIRAIMSIQALEGIDTTYEQAATAYDAVQKEKGD